MKLVAYKGGLLVRNGKIAVSNSPCDCCEDKPCRPVSIVDNGWSEGLFCSSYADYGEVLVSVSKSCADGAYLTIKGDVNDDLAINGKSITDDLGLDPGPYKSIFPCTSAHYIGSQPGPFKLPEEDGIRFPLSLIGNPFTVAVRDTVGFGWGMSLTLEATDENGECCPITVEGGSGSSRSAPAPQFPSDQGVGSELEALLGSLWIKPIPGCKCPERARTMNEMGPQWCRDNIETISGWMREEANYRGLPYFEAVGKALIEKAIEIWDAKQMPPDSTTPT